MGQEESILSWEESRIFSPDTHLPDHVIYAAKTNKVEVIRQYLDDPKYYSCTTYDGDSLLHIAIKYERTEVFDYLLSLEGFPLEMTDSNGKTPLVYCVCHYPNQTREYFALQLLEKGANLNATIPNENTSVLVKACENLYEKVALALISRGADLNRKDNTGKTALHICCGGSCLLPEAAAMLLCYGADPFICNNRGYNAFEHSILYCMSPKRPEARERQSSMRESLFYYTYDRYTQNIFSIKLLIDLAADESPLFETVCNHFNDAYLEEGIDYGKSIQRIFQMKLEYLKMLMKYKDAMRELLETFEWSTDFTKCYEWKLTNLNFLLESEFKQEMLDGLASPKNDEVISVCVEAVTHWNETEKLIFLLSWGMTMTISTFDLDMIYRKVGHCDLLKLLLHMDVKKTQLGGEIGFAKLFYDIETDVEKICRHSQLNRSDVKQALELFAHPCLREYANEYELDLPKVPLLVELARNVFRKYFIKKMKIKNTKQFYSMVNSLTVANVHKQIITYEKKLYSV